MLLLSETIPHSPGIAELLPGLSAGTGRLSRDVAMGRRGSLPSPAAPGAVLPGAAELLHRGPHQPGRDLRSPGTNLPPGLASGFSQGPGSHHGCWHGLDAPAGKREEPGAGPPPQSRQGPPAPGPHPSPPLHHQPGPKVTSSRAATPSLLPGFLVPRPEPLWSLLHRNVPFE